MSTGKHLPTFRSSTIFLDYMALKTKVKIFSDTSTNTTR